MYTQTDISPELERRVQDISQSIVHALHPRSELEVQRSMRFEPIVEEYRRIISSLPIREDGKYSLSNASGEIYIFKDDDRNAKLLLETSFGFNVAWGAHFYLSRPSQDEKLDELKDAALRVVPKRTVGVGPSPLIIPERYDNLSIRKYGRHLGFYNLTDEVSVMFATIKSLELQSDVPKLK